MSCRNRGWESKVHWTVSDFGLLNFFGHIRFLGGQTITPGIFSLPELADRFCGLVQPVRVSQQRDESNGAEKLHRVWVWPAQRPQLARAHQDGDIFRSAVQQLCHLSSQQPGWQVFCRPGRHRRLCYVVSHTSIRFGHSSTTSDPVRPATRPALRAGQVVRPCRVPSISHQPQSFGVLSADHGGFSRLVPTRQHPCYQGQANARCLMPAQPRQFYPKCYRQREPPG